MDFSFLGDGLFSSSLLESAYITDIGEVKVPDTALTSTGTFAIEVLISRETVE